MLQNPCKTLGFKKNMVYKIPPGGGEVNHIQPVAYYKKRTKVWYFSQQRRAFETRMMHAQSMNVYGSSDQT